LLQSAIRLSREGLAQFGQTAVANTHQAVFRSVLMYDKSVLKNLEDDIRLFKREVGIKGDVELITAPMLKQVMVNEVTGESVTKEIPRLVIGSTYMNGSHGFSDQIQQATGASVTVFQLIDDKLLRVSTSIKNDEGKRQVNTYIPSGPILAALKKGELFHQKQRILGKWYLSVFGPLYDWDDKLVGAVYAARPLLNDQIKQYVSDVRIGNGFFYMYETDGTILLHPSLEEGSNLYDIVPEFEQQMDGSFTFVRDGIKRFARTALIKQWGVNIATDLDEVGLNNGLDAKMVRSNLIVGAVVVFFGILLTIALVRSINRPLRELAEKSAKVGEGDYTVEFRSDNKDTIGQLTNSLGSMVEKSKEMIVDIVASSTTLQGASGQLLDISGQMVVNADSTTAIADETIESAASASGNMSSISAAMEESATNLEVIATASGEMSNTIQEIAENSARASATSENAVESAQKSLAGIQQLGEAAKSIGTVTETINEISEQTNLLALNATIEAARAGDAGKGFAVVANEIKELASETASATGQIRRAIDGIQSQTGKTVVDIEKISQIISDVNEIVTGIVIAVEEQAVTTNEIAENVNQASTGLNEINENVTTGSQLADSMSEGVGQVKTRSIAVKNNSEEISSSAAGLSELSKKLSDLVARFHV